MPKNKSKSKLKAIKAKNPTMQAHITRIQIMALYSHAVTTDAQRITEMDEEDRKSMIKVIEEAESRYPEEAAEVKCYQHAPFTRAYWIGAIAAVQMIQTAGGDPDSPVDTTQLFDHIDILEMGDVIIDQINEDADTPTHH